MAEREPNVVVGRDRLTAGTGQAGDSRESLLVEQRSKKVEQSGDLGEGQAGVVPAGL